MNCWFFILDFKSSNVTWEQPDWTLTAAAAAAVWLMRVCAHHWQTAAGDKLGSTCGSVGCTGPRTCTSVFLKGRFSPVASLKSRILNLKRTKKKTKHQTQTSVHGSQASSIFTSMKNRKMESYLLKCESVASDFGAPTGKKKFKPWKSKERRLCLQELLSSAQFGQ